MGRSVHFTLQNLLGTLYSQLSNVCAQAFACLNKLLFSFGLRLFDDTGSFRLSVLPDFFGNLLSLLFRIADALLSFFTSCCKFDQDPLFGGGLLLLAAFCRGQAIRNLLRPLVDHFHQRRPYHFRREYGEDDEDYELRKQS